MRFIKKILWHEYGIKVATVRLRGSINWWGQKYYLPIERILEDARKGRL